MFIYPHTRFAFLIHHFSKLFKIYFIEVHVPIEIKLLRSARGTFCPELIKAFSSGSGSGSNLTKRGADLCQLTLAPARPRQLVSQ